MALSIRMACNLPCLLGIETSGELCSVAVSTEDSLFEKSLYMPYGQAACLIGLIQDVLTDSQRAWKNLTGVVVNRGPGSFTGIRVGVSTGEGIALAGNIPLFGLTGFDIYRSLGEEKNDLLALIDTRRDDCFAGFFKENILDPDFAKVMSYEDIELFCRSRDKFKIIGNCNDGLFTKEVEKRFLKADDLLRAFSFYQDKGYALFPHEPYYLRDPEIHGQ